jgi:hypothetical protein
MNQWLLGELHFPQLEEKKAFLGAIEQAVECRWKRNLMS